MAKKKTRTAKSGVTINLPARPLAHADAIFVVRQRGRKLGEIRISKGGVDWYARNARSPRSMSWRAFAELMDDV